MDILIVFHIFYHLRWSFVKVRVDFDQGERDQAFRFSDHVAVATSFERVEKLSRRKRICKAARPKGLLPKLGYIPSIRSKALIGEGELRVLLRRAPGAETPTPILGVEHSRREFCASCAPGAPLAYPLPLLPALLFAPQALFPTSRQH